MSGIKDYSTTPANNNASPPNGFPEGMAPASLNDGMRQVMADIRSWYEDPAWINYGNTVTYSSGTAFLVATDLTARYAVGRRIRATGTTPFTVEGTITASTYSAPNTTVTVAWDSGSMDSTLNNVFVNMAQASITGGVGTFTVRGNSSAGGGLALGEDTDNGTNTVTLRAPDSIPSNITFKLPSADGSAGGFLVTDGAGNLSFSASLVSGLKTRVLNGLTLANNGTDATNDIDIAAGSIVSDDGTTVMTLSSSITKRLDAAWAVGTGNGGLDTGTIANTTYHLWVINRPDTGVTDVLFSTSATSPTMPTNYTKKAVIGSIVRAGGTIIGFRQNGNEFYLNTPVTDYSSGASAGTSAITATLASVPTGVRFKAFTALTIVDNSNYINVSSLDNADVAPSSTVATGGSSATNTAAQVQVWTNTTAQVRVRQSTNSSSGFRLTTLGWLDTRI